MFVSIFSKLRSSIVVALALAFVAAVAPSASMAAPASVVNTAWAGTENAIKPGGQLAFVFQAGGKALMLDENTRPNEPKTVIHGTFIQIGNQVEIRFKNCIYSGQIHDDLFSGTGRSTEGNPVTWNFQLRYMPPQAQPEKNIAQPKNLRPSPRPRRLFPSATPRGWERKMP